MKTSFTQKSLHPILTSVQHANELYSERFPGDSPARQPIHTVYGGAQIFKAETSQKMGGVALNHMREYTPNFIEFAKALQVRGFEKLPTSPKQISSLEKKLEKNPDEVKRQNPDAFVAFLLYHRVIEKLKREPIEDYRIDFEDGYGNRPDSEEDGHAEFTAKEVARGMKERLLPPFIGIRIKPFTEELKARSIRTLDIFITTLLNETKGKLPENFVVTHPKIVNVEQVSALVRLLEILEQKNNLRKKTLKLELMVETPQSIIGNNGECSLPAFVAAAEGRCVAAHFGVYDYTASNNITAMYQMMMHSACDFAREMMKVSLAGTGVWLSDGATNIFPVGPHRATEGKQLSLKQMKENKEVVFRAMHMNWNDIQHSLRNGYYQGWDLHPAQLPIRYAAVYSFFLQSLDAASHRLKTFVEKAAQATLIGDVFDDAATGQGLLNYFLRGINCGAITEQEATATGLTLKEISTRSFVKILKMRKGK